MPFIDKTTLAYPATNSFALRRWVDERDPTTSDFKNFDLFDLWINKDADRAYIMTGRTASAGTWIQMASTGTGILTVTGDSGGAVSGDGADNIDLLGGDNVTVVGDPGTNSLTIDLDATVADSYDTDSGTAVPALGVLTIDGASGITTSGAGSTVTITAGTTIPTSFVSDAGTATPAGNILNVLGGTGASTAGAGDTLTVNVDADVPTTFTTDSGVATPALNNLNILGAGSASTSGSGSTVTVTSTGGGLMWDEITVVGPTTMDPDMGYVANDASLVQLTLPATASLGAEIKIHGKGTGLFRIEQQAGQTIHFGASSSTTGTGGSVLSTAQYDAIELHCITANTTWAVMGAQGNYLVT